MISKQSVIAYIIITIMMTSNIQTNFGHRKMMQKRTRSIVEEDYHYSSDDDNARSKPQHIIRYNMLEG